MDGGTAVMRAHLDALAAGLRQSGLTTRPEYGGEPPYLHITNPGLVGGPGGARGPLLNERITARRGPDGRWLLHWSWGDPLGPATDLAHAVTKIIHVLSPTPGLSSRDAP
ncbi:hypothetical protein EDD29_1206 [Actinocorallia herbida]|uniref:Uncharacterized protein n=1 Tax=Actinocorallia herbida TaxID=58109 RepID=A0A3N1CQW9_9ACTN|nr:hypothetical protein [Actinocorallia herbida]ROO83699.1 hypothetical protein EDD29_1206 [Actinocorallia herbida]